MFSGVKSGSPRVLSGHSCPRVVMRLTPSYLFGEEILAGQDVVVKRFCRGTVHLRSHWGFGHQLNPCPDCDPRPLPRKCLFQVAAVLWCWERKTEHRQSGHLSGLANASGLPRPPRCAGEWWQSEGRRCLSQRCLTQSCWLLPEAHTQK